MCSLHMCSLHMCSLHSLQPHGLQHTRLPCPSPTPRACSNSCPSCWWCHPTISSSVTPFSSHLQPFPTSESFPMSQFFTLGGHRSFSFSISPFNEYSGLISFSIDWLDLLEVQGAAFYHHTKRVACSSKLRPKIQDFRRVTNPFKKQRSWHLVPSLHGK